MQYAQKAILACNFQHGMAWAHLEWPARESSYDARSQSQGKNRPQAFAGDLAQRAREIFHFFNPETSAEWPLDALIGEMNEALVV